MSKGSNEKNLVTGEQPIITDSHLIDDAIKTLAHHGWNVDRKTLSPVLVVILQKLKAHERVARHVCRYINEPELLGIDEASQGIRRVDSEVKTQ